MSKGIKYALVFTGGVAVGIGVCGANLISYALSDEDIREGIKNKISRKIDTVLYGERPIRNSNRVSYRNYYKEGLDKDREKLKFDEIIFESRYEAEKVIDSMNDIIVKYGFVTVADMYDMTGVPTDYINSKFGWNNLNNAEVIKFRSGYKINLPKPFPI